MICFFQQWTLKNCCYIKLQDIARNVLVSIVLFLFSLGKMILMFCQKSIPQYHDTINVVTPTTITANLYNHIMTNDFSFNGGA